MRRALAALALCLAAASAHADHNRYHCSYQDTIKVEQSRDLSAKVVISWTQPSTGPYNQTAIRIKEASDTTTHDYWHFVTSDPNVSKSGHNWTASWEYTTKGYDASDSNDVLDDPIAVGSTYKLRLRARELDNHPVRPAPRTLYCDEVSVTLVTDSRPQFDGTVIPDQQWETGVDIGSVAMPSISGGNFEISVTFDPPLPEGVSYDAAAGALVGTPTTDVSALITATVSDGDTITGAGDEDTVSFNLVMDVAPSFADDAEIPPQYWIVGEEVPTIKLPLGRDGNGALSYRFDPALPQGTYYVEKLHEIKGAPEVADSYGIKMVVYDADASTGPEDEDFIKFGIVVEEDTSPVFGEGPGNQFYLPGVAIPALKLPRAAGGNRNRYYLEPSSWNGLEFDRDTREVNGTPLVPGTREFTYTVLDYQNDTDSLRFSITVQEDTAPAFGEGPTDQTVIAGEMIAPVELPQAADGNGPLAYALEPSSWNGLAYDADSRQLSGAAREAGRQTFNWTVEDADGDRDSVSFSVTVLEDSAPAFSAGPAYYTVAAGEAVEPIGLPQADGGNAPLSYALEPPSWNGLAYDAATSSVRGVPRSEGSQTFVWKAVDADGDSAEAQITVTAVAAAAAAPPRFGGVAVAAQVWTQGIAIPPLTLPAAVGGSGPLTYSIAPALPPGIALNTAARALSGIPAEARAPTAYTWTATDSSGGSASLSFTIEVKEDSQPGFDQAAAPPQGWTLVWTQDAAIPPPLTLPAAAGGNVPLTYSIAPALPPGMALDAATGALSGIPAEARAPTTYTLTVTDADGDSASLSFTIEVKADLQPSFGEAAVPDQSWAAGGAVDLALPRAAGGNGVLRYALSPQLPAGLSFDADALRVTGAPREPAPRASWTLTATDADGDAASLRFAARVGPAAPATAGELPDLALTAGGAPVEVDARGAFAGSGLTFEAASSDGGVAAVQPRGGGIFAVAPRGEGTASVSIEASNESGSARAAFNVSVATSPVELRSLESALAAHSRALMGSAADVVGGRLGGTGSRAQERRADGPDRERGPGGGALGALAGWLKDLAPMPGGVLHSSGDAAPRPGAAGPAPGRSQAGGARRSLPRPPLARDGWLAGRSFEWLLADGSAATAATGWTAWGARDLQDFSGGNGQDGYDGDWRSWYLGLEFERGDRWLAGLAASRGSGETSWSAAGGLAGSLDSDLTMLHPYAQARLDGGLEIWGWAGFGQGGIEHWRKHAAGSADEADLSARLGALGFRRRMAERGAARVSLTGDAAASRLETDDGTGSLAGLSASTNRLRAGVNAEFGSGGPFAGHLGFNGRYDGGGGETGAAAELLGGIRFAQGRFEARLQGRSLLAHAGSGYKEMSLSAELSLRAGEGGGGLSFSLMPSWGAPGSMAPGGAGFVAGGGALWSGERMKALAPRGGRENLRQLRWSGQAAWGIPLNTGYSEIFGRPLLLRLVARRQRNGLEDELLVGLELTGAEAR